MPEKPKLPRFDKYRKIVLTRKAIGSSEVQVEVRKSGEEDGLGALRISLYDVFIQDSSTPWEDAWKAVTSKGLGGAFNAVTPISVEDLARFEAILLNDWKRWGDA